MKRLSTNGFAQAQRFLKAHARPLEKALFAYEFAEGSTQSVVEELARFANDDGGFGRALEPDVRTPSSSALATGIGLSIPHELGCSPDHALVTGAVQYLLDTFDEGAQVWRIIPHDANDDPHAPWWHDEDGSLARTFDDYLVIPRAQIVGLLHHVSPLVPADWLDAVTDDTVTAVETLSDDAFGGGGDTLRYALDLAETEPLPQRFKDRLMPRLRALTEHVVCRDPQEWTGYCAAPLKIAPSPDAATADVLGDSLQTHLDYVIDHQTPDGTWEPTWTWGDFYPDAWEVARREWRGQLTLATLTSLRAFGRVDL